MRNLVDALDRTHKSYVTKLVSNGGVSLEASKLGREYKDIQREIIVVDIVEKKKTVLTIIKKK
jgi:hypothetical protein